MFYSNYYRQVIFKFKGKIKKKIKSKVFEIVVTPLQFIIPNVFSTMCTYNIGLTIVINIFIKIAYNQ